MSKFIINQNVQANGDYEVHNLTTGCSFMPYPQNRVDLGEHLNCFSAVLAAKESGITLESMDVITAVMHVIPARTLFKADIYE